MAAWVEEADTCSMASLPTSCSGKFEKFVATAAIFSENDILWHLNEVERVAKGQLLQMNTTMYVVFIVPLRRRGGDG